MVCSRLSLNLTWGMGSWWVGVSPLQTLLRRHSPQHHGQRLDARFGAKGSAQRVKVPAPPSHMWSEFRPRPGESNAQPFLGVAVNTPHPCEQGRSCVPPLAPNCTRKATLVSSHGPLEVSRRHGAECLAQGTSVHGP